MGGLWEVCERCVRGSRKVCEKFVGGLREVCEVCGRFVRGLWEV